MKWGREGALHAVVHCPSAIDCLLTGAMSMPSYFPCAELIGGGEKACNAAEDRGPEYESIKAFCLKRSKARQTISIAQLFNLLVGGHACLLGTECFLLASVALPTLDSSAPRNSCCGHVSGTDVASFYLHVRLALCMSSCIV
jgi:hypothetical protein